jgi:hypothetical protein
MWSPEAVDEVRIRKPSSHNQPLSSNQVSPNIEKGTCILASQSRVAAEGPAGEVLDLPKGCLLHLHFRKERLMGG